MLLMCLNHRDVNRVERVWFVKLVALHPSLGEVHLNHRHHCNHLNRLNQEMKKICEYTPYGINCTGQNLGIQQI